MRFESRLWLAGSMSIALLLTGILGYRVLEDFTWLEALYMTAITLSTVGYREVRPLSPTGEIFTILLLASGVGVVFYTAVTVAENVVPGEIQQYFKRRRMERRIHSITTTTLSVASAASVKCSAANWRRSPGTFPNARKSIKNLSGVKAQKWNPNDRFAAAAMSSSTWQATENLF